MFVFSGWSRRKAKAHLWQGLAIHVHVGPQEPWPLVVLVCLGLIRSPLAKLFLRTKTDPWKVPTSSKNTNNSGDTVCCNLDSQPQVSG